MRISIMGCGWLGLPLGAHLVSLGHQVKGSTTSTDKIELIRSSGITPYLLALNPKVSHDPKDFFQSDLLIINIPPRNREGQDHFHRKQLQHLLAQVETESVQWVIFISSTSAYQNENRVVTENDASYDAKSRAGISLLEMEEILTKSTQPTTVLRMGGLYGPNRNPLNFFKNKPVKGANAPVNMVHLDDCISVISNIIDNKKINKTYNVVAPGNMNKKEFYTHLAERAQTSPPAFDMDSVDFKKVSSEKLIQDLNYQFIHTH